MYASIAIGVVILFIWINIRFNVIWRIHDAFNLQFEKTPSPLRRVAGMVFWNIVQQRWLDLFCWS